MVFVVESKNQPTETNIEKNFSMALKDIPTLMELATLALYHITVSKPFMQHVRQHENFLVLEPFFQMKTCFLQSIAESP